ncbi:TPA: hypothetical protein ACH3X1_011428 [Trebouxia sp. C0004]
MWGSLSPFSEDHLIFLQPMTQTQIAGLLQQYTAHRFQSDFGFNMDVFGLAECIFESTEGFHGLVGPGLCCSEVDSKNILSVEDWLRWCGVNLVTRVQQQCNFAVLSDTTGLLAMAIRNERLRQVMQMFCCCEALVYWSVQSGVQLQKVRCQRVLHAYPTRSQTRLR